MPLSRVAVVKRSAAHGRTASGGWQLVGFVGDQKRSAARILLTELAIRPGAALRLTPATPSHSLVSHIALQGELRQRHAS